MGLVDEVQRMDAGAIAGAMKDGPVWATVDAGVAAEVPEWVFEEPAEMIRHVREVFDAREAARSDPLYLPKNKLTMVLAEQEAARFAGDADLRHLVTNGAQQDVRVVVAA
jgi:hypothetical protein